jgi:hypothetical protein
VRTSERNSPRLFISYSHDDARHSERVLALAQTLNHEGVDTEIDQYHQDKLIDWPRWCAEQLRPENSNFVLMICSAEYKRRLENRVQFDEGRGVFWEGALISRELYHTKSNERFIPVLLEDEPEDSLPAIISTWTHFRVRHFGISSDDPGYTGLYRLLTAQPRVKKEKTGIIKVLSPIAQKAIASKPDPEAKLERVIHPRALPGNKKCKPFKLEVFAAKPEAGYKFELVVEKECSVDDDPIWKLIFDLYKKNTAGDWDHIVHISFKAVDPNERQGVENMVNGISVETATILTSEVHPAAKAVANTPEASLTQKQRLHDALSVVALSAA